MTTTPKALPETQEYKMHPDRCRVACSRESCTCAPNRFDWEARPLVDRLSDEADQCRNDGANDIAALLDEAVQALNARTPADSLASAGGVEVVAYLVSGGRIFKDQAVTHKDSARTRIAERKDGSVAHPLVKQSDYLAALSKEREVADGLADAVEALMAGSELSQPGHWGCIRMPSDKAMDQGLAALTAHRESRGGK